MASGSGRLRSRTAGSFAGSIGPGGLDPLQNILDCAAMIVLARERQQQELNRWIAMIGEMDHVCEIHRQLKELGCL